jgi:hypothetical protein
MKSIRAHCLELLWQQAQETLYLTQEQYEQGLEGWTLDPLYRPDGSISLIFVVRGSEFHFAKFGADVQASREHLQRYPGTLIQQYGYALTKTPKTDTRQIRFNRRVGFFFTHQDEWDVHLRIEKLRNLIQRK